MTRSKLLPAIVATGLLTGGAGTAQALEAGDWLFRLGGSMVDPKSNSGSLGGAPITVEDDTQLSFTVVRMLNPNLGAELLASLPFEHDIRLDGSTIGSTKHLPPTVSLQYYFNPTTTIRPYIGAGLNYTYFWDEETRGLGGAGLDVDESWGLAAQIGLDLDINPQWFVNADVRYIDIDTDATIEGVGTVGVDISPTVYTLAVGYRF